MLSRRTFGKVIAPLRYVYGRSLPALQVSVRILRAERRLSLPPGTRVLIRYYTSHLNGCPFCSDLAAYAAHKADPAFRKWQEFAHFATSERFTAREKALLAYLEQIAMTVSVTDEVFEALQVHFSEKEIVEITWLNATEHYFNRIAIPLGLPSDGLAPRED